MVSKGKEHWFSRIENMHPYQTLVYLGMVGSGIIFLFIWIAFLVSKNSFPISGFSGIPKSFVLSTAFLLISAYTSEKAVPAYLAGSIKKLKRSISLTLLFGGLFTGFQFLGWKELTAMGVNFNGLPSGGYIYVLSGIHILHLVGAMGFATSLVWDLHRCERDGVRGLFLLTNPYDKMKIQLFSTYWRFMDLVWIILFFSLVWAA